MKSLYLSEWNAFIRYYDIPGEGDTVIYLPALCFPAIANFLPVATHSEMPGHRAILIDFLGSGFSDHPENFSYSMDDHAKSVARVLDHEGIESATLVGHSMGGTVAIMLTSSRPDLVSNLIVGEGNIIPGGGVVTRGIASHTLGEYTEKIFPEARKRLFEAAIEGDSEADMLSGMWLTASPSSLHGNAKSLVDLAPLIKEKYFGLRIPRTFIFGEETFPECTDKVSPDAPEPDELEAHGINIGVVPNAGHIQMLENLDGFVSVLKEAMKFPRGTSHQGND